MSSTPRPGLITGTASEFIGRKPLPRVLRNRRVAFFLGPPGVGKSTVARLLAGSGHACLHTRELPPAMVLAVRSGRWPQALSTIDTLVIDGPTSLRYREGAVNMLRDLAVARARAGRRTLFCEAAQDGSIERLITSMDVGTCAVVGLRFPTGRRARLRCARRTSDQLGLPAEVVDGSDAVDPWSYDRMVAWMVECSWRK